MCETCSQVPVMISREDFENAIQTPTCPECGRTVPADEAWEVYDSPPYTMPESLVEVLRKLEALDA